MVKSPRSPRSFSVDATTSAGQKSDHLWDHGPGGGGGRGGGGGQGRRGSNFATASRKSGPNNSLTAGYSAWNDYLVVLYELSKISTGQKQFQN